MLLTYEELDALVKSRLGKKRYEHTIAVTKLSLELAKQYGIPTELALNAAMLHDITKQESIDTQLQMIEKSDIMNDNILAENENIYHSITAYIYAKNTLKIDNQDVLNAIRYHTTGRKNMSILEKIIFTADTVSYDRTYKDAKRLRELSFEDINECILLITKFLITDLINKQSVINVNTIECYNMVLTSKEVI